MLLVAALMAMSPPKPVPMDVEIRARASDVQLPIRVLGGSGPATPTLVGLHGGPSLGADYLFEALRPLASPSLRIAVFHQRGSVRVTPKDPSAPKAFSPEKYADDLAAVLDALGIERAHLLAHSWGGLTAYAFAQRNANRIASLVLVDAVAHPPPEVLKPLPGNCSPETIAAITAQAEGYDFRSALARLDVPVLLVFGAQDPLDAGTADETQAALARARVRRVTIPACGHYPFFEQPAAFFSELRAFLKAGT
jgi:pimeloyl-ACP methyl ester carboxylesterase